jgi:hypothetical protein
MAAMTVQSDTHGLRKDAPASEYKAFISYKHVSSRAFAVTLEATLKQYAKPLLARPIRIFRDETHFTPGNDLPSLLVEALDASEFLILLASPDAAKSPWVRDEMEHWCGTLGRTEKLIIVLLAGEIGVDDETKRIDWSRTDALPPVLEKYLQRVPLYLDVRKLMLIENPSLADPEFKRAVNAIAARVRGIDPNEMLGEEIRIFRRNRRLRNAAVAALATLTVAAASGAYIAMEQRNVARDALLESAAGQSVLLTRDGRPDEAWASLRKAVEVARSPFAPDVLPKSVHEAALMALIEDRSGPTLSLELSQASSDALKANEGDSPIQPGAFSPDGSRVAAAFFFELGIWRTQDGGREWAVSLPHPVEQLFFHDSGQVVFAVGTVRPPEQQEETAPEKQFITVLDIASGQRRTHEVTACHNAIPCIAATPGQSGRLLNIRHIAAPERLAREGALGKGDVPLVPGSDYMGLAQGRYHVFVRQDHDPKAEANVMLVFDEVTQKAVKQPLLGESAIRAAVASEAPIILVGSPLDETLQIYRIEPGANGRGPTVRPGKQWTAQNSAGTKHLGLDAQGRTAFYTNNRWGTGGGNGLPLTAALDVGTGRQLWSKTFEGYVVFAPNDRLQAHYGDRTSVIDGQTGERLFDVTGGSVAFSADGQALLTMQPNTRIGKTVQVSWRLVEVIPVPTLVRENQLPLSIRGRCNLEVSPFRILSDRSSRRWNQHDWQRVEDSAMAVRLAEKHTPGPLSRKLQIKWVNGALELTEVTAEDSADLQDPAGPSMKGTLDDIASKYPEARGFLKQDPNISLLLSSNTSSDGRWIATVGVYEENSDNGGRWVDWTIRESKGTAGRVVASGQMREKDKNSSGINNFHETVVHFLEKMSAAAVQKDECSLVLIALPEGREIGTVDLAFSNLVSAQALSTDLLAVFSRDWYESTRSLQIISVPARRQGPWILFDDNLVRTEQDNVAPGKPKPNTPAEPPKSLKRSSMALAPLHSSACDGEMSMVDEQYLLIRPAPADACDVPTASTPALLRIPPWGLRLERYLLP